MDLKSDCGIFCLVTRSLEIWKNQNLSCSIYQKIDILNFTISPVVGDLMLRWADHTKNTGKLKFGTNAYLGTRYENFSFFPKIRCH